MTLVTPLTYKLLKFGLIIVGGTLLAAGFDFKTPAQHFRELHVEDSLNEVRISRLERADVYIEAIARGQCLDRSRREWQLMGLPCDTLLRGVR